jgi:hypothetical protein
VDEMHEGNAMAPDDPVFLSPEGLARKESMLRGLQGAVIRRRRTRTAFKAGALAAITIAAVAVALRMGGDAPRGPEIAVPPPPAAVPSPREDRRPAGAPRVAVIRDDPGILERARIGDDELVALLRASGRPAGIIRTPGRVIVPGAGK